MRRLIALPVSRPALALISFGLIQVSFYLGESMMSYLAPLILESHLRSPALMGLIIGSSSLFGLVADSILGRMSNRRSFAFLLISLLLLAPTFPIFMLFGQQGAIFFLAAMAIWGIYYELLYFGNYRFIHTFLSSQQHAIGWGTLETFRALAASLGPIIAGYLLGQTFEPALRVSFYLFLTSLVLGLAFLKIFRQIKPIHLQNPEEQTPSPPEPHHQLQTLWTLFRYVWPLWLCDFALIMVDATFWTVGPLFSESLKDLHPLGGLLLTAYVLPSMFVGLLAAPLGKRTGKKAMAFMGLLGSGVCLVLLRLVSEPVAVLSLVSLSAICGGLAYPNLVATFEDYVVRLHRHSGEMIALERSAVNIAYVVGPLLAGIGVSLVGYQMTFSSLGVLVILIAVVCLSVVPSKIRMPQAKLASVNQD